MIKVLVFLILAVVAASWEADAEVFRGDIDVIAGGQTRGTVEPWDRRTTPIPQNTADWYRFTLHAPHKVNFHLTAVGSRPSLCLYNESVGNLIPHAVNLRCSTRSSVGVGNGLSPDGRFLPGTYYVRIRASGGRADYLLTYGVESPRVHLSTTRLSLSEGDTGAYTVRLGSRPSGNVTVHLASDRPAVTVSPATLTFTTRNWDRAQTVTVRAVRDPDADDETATLSHRVAGYGSVTDGGTVTVNVNDTDTGLTFGSASVADQRYVARKTVTTMTLPAATGGKGPLSYTLTPALPAGLNFDPQTRALSGAPTTAMPARTYAYTVTDADGNTDSLSFTIEVEEADESPAFGAGTTITPKVYGQDRAIPLEILPAATGGNGTLSFTLTPALPAGLSFNPQTRALSGTPTTAMPARMYTYTVTDADGDTDSLFFAIEVVSAMAVTLTPATLTIRENGGMATYKVKLSARPGASVTVTLTSDPTDVVTVSQRVLTFTLENWNTEQTVTVTGVNDAIDNAGDKRAVTIIHRANDGLILGSVEVTVTDDDSRGVTFSTRRVIEVNEGEIGTYTVKLRTQPTGNVTVKPVLSDRQREFMTITPATLTFTTANWNRAQTVTVRAVPDDTLGNGYRISFTRLTHRVTGSDYGDGNFRGPSVRIIYSGRHVNKPLGIIETIKKVIRPIVRRGILSSPQKVIGRDRIRHMSKLDIGVRGFRNGGGATLTVGGRPIMHRAATLALAPSDAGWRSTPGADPEGEYWRYRSLGVDELLRSSAFELTLGAAEDEAQNGALSKLTLWGQGDFQFFDSKPSAGLRYDGNLKAGYLGVETRFEKRWLAGAAVSRTKVVTDYAHPQADGGHEDGRLDLTLTTAYPYLRLASDPRSEFWLLLGLGWGEVTNQRVEASARESSNARTFMVAGGARRALTTKGGVDVALLGDAGYGYLKSNSGPQLIDGLSIDSGQVRLGVEGSYTAALEGGSSLKPFVEVAGRYDRGDDHDVGLEIVGGVSWTDPALRLGVEARGRVMVLHSADSYREYGASVAAKVSPGRGGEGLSLSLSPRLGAVTDGADALQRDDAFRHATSFGGNAVSLNTRAGYGIRDWLIRGLLTPFGELDFQESGSRRVRMGLRFERSGSGLGTLSLELSGQRRKSGESAPEHRMDLTARLRF